MLENVIQKASKPHKSNYSSIEGSKAQPSRLADNHKAQQASKSHMRYEDFLISKAQQFKEKLMEKAKELEHE